MNTVFAHCGCHPITLDALFHAAPPPPATNTYCPVPHHSFVTELQVASQSLLVPNGYEFSGNSIVTTPNMNRLFGVMTFKAPGDMSLNNTLQMSIGYRNSYDRSMSVGMVIGTHVFVCDNLAFSGDVVVLRKHTKNITDTLRRDLLMALYDAKDQFKAMVEFTKKLQQVRVTRGEGLGLLGVMQAVGMLPLGVAKSAMEQWTHPSFADTFGDENGWALHNALTFATKIMKPEKLFALQRTMNGVFTHVITQGGIAATLQTYQPFNQVIDITPDAVEDEDLPAAIEIETAAAATEPVQLYVPEVWREAATRVGFTEDTEQGYTYSKHYTQLTYHTMRADVDVLRPALKHLRKELNLNVIPTNTPDPDRKGLTISFTISNDPPATDTEDQEEIMINANQE